MFDWFFSSTAGMVVSILAGALVLYFFCDVVPQFIFRPQGTKIKARDTRSPALNIEAYMNGADEKYVLTVTDIRNIQTHENRTRNSSLLFGALITLLGGGLIRGAFDSADIGMAVFGGVLALFGIAALIVSVNEVNKKISAAEGGCCAACVIKVDEKLWCADSDGGYEYYVRCGEVVVSIPNRRMYNSIGGYLLAVKYFYDPRRNLISYYPAAM